MSQTQLSNYVGAAAVIALLLQHVGIIIPQDNIAFVLFSVVTLGSQAYSFYQRYKKGDLTLGGVRKA